MIKKILPFLLIITILVSVMVTPVSATSGASVNILDFTSYDGANTFSVKSRGTFPYSVIDTLGSVRSYFIDIVFVVTGTPITEFILIPDGSSAYSGTVTQLGPSLYRATFDLQGLVVYTYKLGFRNDGSNYSYITLLSFNVHTISSNRVDIAANVKAEPGNEVVKQPGFSCQVQTAPIIQNKYTTSIITVSISESYWRDYDFIDFDGRISTYNINSISVLASDGSYIPIEHNFINTGLVDNDDNTRGYFYYSGRIDLSSVDKTSISGLLKLRFAIEEYNSSLFSLYNLSGVVIGDSVNVESTWYQILFRSISNGFSHVLSQLQNFYNKITSSFNSLFTKFDTLIHSLVPSSVDDSVTNDIQQSDNALGDLSTDIESLSPTVDAGSIDVDIGGYVDSDSAIQANNILISITSQSFAQTMFLILASFSLIGYIFFGKR